MCCNRRHLLAALGEPQSWCDSDRGLRGRLERLLSHSSLSKLERRVSERIREAGSEAQMKLNSLLTLRVAIKSATLG